MNATIFIWFWHMFYDLMLIPDFNRLKNSLGNKLTEYKSSITQTPFCSPAQLSRQRAQVCVESCSGDAKRIVFCCILVLDAHVTLLFLQVFEAFPGYFAGTNYRHTIAVEKCKNGL